MTHVEKPQREFKSTFLYVKYSWPKEIVFSSLFNLYHSTFPNRVSWLLYSSSPQVWLRWQRIHLQCGRPRFNPWVRKSPWRRKLQPTIAFLPGKFHGQRSVAGYSPWGRKELDMTKRLTVLKITAKTVKTIRKNQRG